MDSKNNTSLFSTILCKLVEKNVSFTFKNKTITIDNRENASIESIASFGDKVIITTPNKDFLVLDCFEDLTSFHPFCAF